MLVILEAAFVLVDGLFPKVLIGLVYEVYWTDILAAAPNAELGIVGFFSLRMVVF